MKLQIVNFIKEGFEVFIAASLSEQQHNLWQSEWGLGTLYLVSSLNSSTKIFFEMERWSFFRAVWGLGTFSLDPFAVPFSGRQPSNEDAFTANVLYFCNLSFKRCYNESPLRFLFSLSWILYLLMCFLFQTMTANLPVCVLVWCIHWRNMLLIHLASSNKHIHLDSHKGWMSYQTARA